MTRRRPNYEEIRRLEHELGLDDDGLVNEKLVEEKPTSPPSLPPIETLADYVNTRKASTNIRPVTLSSVSVSPEELARYHKIKPIKLRTIYGPDGKPLYDTPAA